MPVKFYTLLKANSRSTLRHVILGDWHVKQVLRKATSNYKHYILPVIMFINPMYQFLTHMTNLMVGL